MKHALNPRNNKDLHDYKNMTITAWIESKKIKGFLYVIWQFMNHELNNDDFNAIQYGMIDTNDEKNQ